MKTFVDKTRPGHSAEYLDQITADLQRKLSDDVTRAIIRTIELSRSPPETINLVMQAAVQTLKLLHDALELHQERLSITAVALLCAKALEDARDKKGAFRFGDALDECERQAERLERAK